MYRRNRFPRGADCFRRGRILTLRFSAPVHKRTDGQIIIRTNALHAVGASARILHIVFYSPGERFVNCPSTCRVIRAFFFL